MSTNENGETNEYQERISHAMVNYEGDTMNKYSYAEVFLSSANLKHQKKFLEAGLSLYYKNILNCIKANQRVLNEILLFNLSLFDENDRPKIPNPLERRTLRLDNVRVNDMLAAIAREWSDEGTSKRKLMWDKLLHELSKIIKSRTKNMSTSEVNEFRVVIPGAGAGRLPFDVANAHSDIQVITNEENMNLFYANNFVLNKCKIEKQYKIYPNIHDLTNKISSTDAVKPIVFPDILMTEGKQLQLTPYSESFRDFCENDLEAESVDCVVSWFYLDTAHNVIEYITLIEKILKSNGVWINIGGLDYMYEQFNGATSIETPYEHLKGVIIDLGLNIIKEEMIENYEYFLEDSLLKRIYNCPFIMCKKGGIKYEFIETVDIP